MAQVIPVVTAVHSRSVALVEITHLKQFQFVQDGNIQFVLAEAGHAQFHIRAAQAWDVQAGFKDVT